MKRKVSASGIFLLELIMAILIFAAAASICVSVFVKAHTMNTEAKTLNQAVTSAGSMAELIRGSGSLEEIENNVHSLFPDAVITEESESLSAAPEKNGSDGSSAVTVTQYFDKNGDPEREVQDVPYCMTTVISFQEEGLLKADIKYTGSSDNSSIYETEISHVAER